MTSESNRILWLDDDGGYIYPFVKKLQAKGYEVDVVKSVSEAEEYLERNFYSLLLLDVMIPIINNEEEQLYPVESTDSGFKTGLQFFIKNASLIREKSGNVLVFTVRPDVTIQGEFQANGLSPESFATKVDLRRMPDFITKVEAQINSGTSTQGEKR